MASFIYNQNPNLIQHVIDAISEGHHFEYLLVRLLYNLSYSLEARMTMTSLGGIEVIMGLLRLVCLETAMYSLELLENLTDSITPHLRSRLAIRTNAQSLLSVVRRPDEDVLFLLRPLLVLLGRIACHGPTQQVVYRMRTSFTRSLVRLEHLTVSKKHHTAIFRLRKHIQLLEMLKDKPWMTEA